MRKMIVAWILALSMIGVSLNACGVEEEKQEYAAVCVDPNTEQRLEDDACEDGDSDFLTYAVIWYMLANSSHPYPAVGERATKSHYKTTKPKNAIIRTGLPVTGGSSVKTYVNKTYNKPKNDGSQYKKKKDSGYKPYKPGGSSKRR